MIEIIWHDLKMTSNTTPSPYVASASSEYNTTHSAWKAFNGTAIDLSDRWRSTNATSQWIQLDFGVETTVDRFSITSVNSTEAILGGTPQDYNLLGSLNGTTWTTIKSFNSSSFSAGETREFIVGFFSNFRFYRLEVSSPQTSVGYLNIGEVRFGYEKLTNKSLILHDGEYKKFNETIPEVPPQIITPLMTDFTTGDCTAFTSSTLSRQPIWKAFDRTIGVGSNHYDSGDITTVDFGVVFTSPKKLKSYVFNGYGTTGVNVNLPSSWVLQGSNDTTTGLDGTWIDLDARSDVAWTATNERRTYTLNQEVEYKAYKFSNVQNHTKVSYIYVPDLELYSPPIPEIKGYIEDVSNTLPTKDMFLSDGMDSLSPLFDRKIEMLAPVKMNKTTQELVSNDGRVWKVYSKTMDLKKLLNVTKIQAEVK